MVASVYSQERCRREMAKPNVLDLYVHQSQSPRLIYLIRDPPFLCAIRAPLFLCAIRLIRLIRDPLFLRVIRLIRLIRDPFFLCGCF